ncbi:helix-turn-helix transcriptional regulator [Streptomyces sp. NPDC049954]|uniref:helix-turn-helix transcriptional regulator n=1 Tax=Streptomyces sp. NPDC049954 TaxID=3155779 RepID=UPI0034204C25
MGEKSIESSHPHPMEPLCETGQQLYAASLRAGRVTREEADAAPCVLDMGLLHPDPDDPVWLHPVQPSIALARLIHPIEDRILKSRRSAVALTEVFEPLMALTSQEPATTHAITVLEGLERINATLDRTSLECTEEVLTLQPGSGRPPYLLEDALRRVEPLFDRPIRMRTLYHHTARHHPSTLAYVERVTPRGVEFRTMEQLPERLIIIDRKAAFIPISGDRKIALELRHPGLVRYLANVFDQFWTLAVPWKEVTSRPDLSGITSTQLSIARLLVEGHVDEAIARRLGMNVRTCRAHIAKLAATLGSGSRAQLGYLIAQSGLLDALAESAQAAGNATETLP